MLGAISSIQKQKITFQYLTGGEYLNKLFFIQTPDDHVKLY